MLRGLILSLLVGVMIGTAYAEDCVVEDNGTGTATLPPVGCQYASPNEFWQIIDGLPQGTTIDMDGPMTAFVCGPHGWCSMPLPPGECEIPGGILGGDVHCYEATLQLDVVGTGELTGFNHELAVPLSVEVHTGPRNAGDPVQAFAADMYQMDGEVFDDPFFCEFRLAAGTDFGLPSPGQTTLTQLPSGDFAVDSFFDITYWIEFAGCQGTMLQGYSGATTATIRIITQAGQPEAPVPTVSEWGLVAMSLLMLTAGTLVHARRRPIQL